MISPITPRLVPKLHRPILKHRSLVPLVLGDGPGSRINAREDQINRLVIKFVPDSLELYGGRRRSVDRRKGNSELAQKENRPQFKKQDLAQFGLFQGGAALFGLRGNKLTLVRHRKHGGRRFFISRWKSRRVDQQTDWFTCWQTIYQRAADRLRRVRNSFEFSWESGIDFHTLGS
jgi:hypothetical protein